MATPTARPDDGPRRHYRDAGEAAAAEVERLERTILVTSRLRTGGFFLLVVPLLFLETTSRDRWPVLLGLAAVGAVAFVTLVRRHRRIRRNLERARLRVRIAAEALARMDRRWDELPPPPLETVPEDHPSAADLDVVGRASLAHLIGRVSTAPGRAVLARLLLDPLANLPDSGIELVRGIEGSGDTVARTPDSRWAENVTERQEAVRSLAEHVAFRDRLELLGREARGEADPRDARTFLEWAQSPGPLDDRRGSLYLARLLAVFTPLTLTGWLIGWLPGALPVLGGLAAMVLQRRVSGDADARLSAAEAGEGNLARWTALLEHGEDVPATTPALERLARAIREPGPGAVRALRGLRRITDTAGVRRSSLAHFPLVVLFAWDLHMLEWAERWRRRHGHAVDGWIRALGELEAISALGGLLHDHPGWAFPDLSAPPEEGIRGEALGHPLLPPDRCVTNDVAVPPPGELLLVTGSNMAGKTTLLRAIGANQILALAGGPVAAAGLRTRPILPWTAMRVRDSLAEGVSYFLAELHRLRRVVEAAREGPVLYLLDEILQGTNSAERRTAARIVLDQLLDTGSVGAITTHDLTLADTEELRARSVDIHFREEVRDEDGRKALHFDYRLRPGPATSRNALLLLDIVGLGGDAPPGSSRS